MFKEKELTEEKIRLICLREIHKVLEQFVRDLQNQGTENFFQSLPLFSAVLDCKNRVSVEILDLEMKRGEFDD